VSGRIALIETGAANLYNIALALTRMRYTVTRVQRASELVEYDSIVFPGVANFGFVAQSLAQGGLDRALRSAIRGGAPYLGICVGMQMLYESSEEAPGVAGLGILPGTVRRLSGPKIPQMGWNRVAWRERQDGFTDGWAYFANSYAAGADAAGIVAVSEYGAPFGAVCAQGNVAGMQFHPERSGPYGLAMLDRFLKRREAVYAR
jgi:imidazole glycerol phosphate synthase glutamine amidotransferase subunit